MKIFGLTIWIGSRIKRDLTIITSHISSRPINRHRHQLKIGNRSHTTSHYSVWALYIQTIFEQRTFFLITTYKYIPMNSFSRIVSVKYWNYVFYIHMSEKSCDWKKLSSKLMKKKLSHLTTFSTNDLFWKECLTLPKAVFLLNTFFFLTNRYN